MRVTLTSLAVLALLCPAQVCLAQDAPPDKASVEAAAEAAKTEGSKPQDPKTQDPKSPDSEPSRSAVGPHKAKAGRGRVGTLSPEEAKRAARARKRAAAEFKGRGGAAGAKKADVAKPSDKPAHAAISDKPAHAAIETEPAKATETPAKEPVKAAETPPAKEPVKAAETPPAKEPVKAAETLPAKEPVKAAETPPAKEPMKAAETPPSKQPVKAPETSRVPDGKPADLRPSKQATRTIDKTKPSAASRAVLPRVRYHYAGNAQRAPRVGDTVPPGVRLDPVPRRYWRYSGTNGRFVGVEPPRRRYFVERFGPPWRFMARGPVVEAYPPYPAPYGAYEAYPPSPVYVDP